MKLNYVDLFVALYDDLGIDKKSTSYVIDRLRNEGVHVVTVLLPAFSKHVLSCIENGEWRDFSSAVTKYRGLPVLFRGFLTQLFTYSTKDRKFLVRPDACPVSLLVIRQACEYFYKLSLDFTADQLTKAERKFIENDNEVFQDGDYDISFVEKMRSNFETYYPRTSRISFDDIVAKARPGSGTFSNWKDGWSSSHDHQYGWYERNKLPATVPPEASNLAHAFRFNKRAPVAKVADVDPSFSEVLFVPKDSRGPRVICREPYDKLLFQMGFFDSITGCLEQDTQHRINFTSQEINRRLAHTSSIDRSYATLDLSDASDMVSYHIVRRLFRYVPFYKILRFRTGTARLPSGSTRKLRKLAGMGSGFTFPTMALVIHLAICTHVSRRLNVGYRDASSKVYVYGDDIVVPREWYGIACQALTFVGLKVNLQKSYSRSNFRESCGGDYFHGNDVTPVRCKLSGSKPKILGASITFDEKDIAGAVLNLERHARELVINQLYSASSVVYSALTKVLGPLPYVSGKSEPLGIYVDAHTALSVLGYDDSGTYDDVSVWVVKPKKIKTRGACPYRHLISTLCRGENKGPNTVPWDRHLDPVDSQTEYGVTSVPRKVKLQRVTVSGLALI